MTDKDFLQSLRTILNRPTSYNNVYPYNVGYYNGYTLSFDCWNLVKAICWTNGAIADNWIVGNYAICTYPATPLGDWNGKQILDACTDVSGDMAHIQDGEYLLYEGDSHAGVYFGDGKVAECTVGWGQNGVILSDIDEYGRSFFNGVQRGRWYRHGKLPFVEYSSEEYPVFNVGDEVMIVQGAKVYGTNVYFASWVYETPLIVTEQTGDRVVVCDDEYVIGAVNANDLLPYVEQKPEEPFHPGQPKPPEDDLDKEVGWFGKFIIGLIKGLLTTITDIFKPKEKHNA